MRLLNIYTLQFQEFFENEIPSYHILSHRWSRDEISHEEFCRERIPNKEGYRKVKDFCRFIRRRRNDSSVSLRSVERPYDGGLIADHLSDLTVHDGDYEDAHRPALAGGEWVWVDTCCIDKRSSAELTEAINSMFKWYAGSYECIVHLADVPSWQHLGRSSPYGQISTTSASYKNQQFEHVAQSREESWVWGGRASRVVKVKRILGDAFHYLEQSVWFTRGWTLQELLAPQTVVFCNAAWEILGHVCKNDACTRAPNAYGLHLTEAVSQITNIPEQYLGGNASLYGASIAQRMSWASKRTTTRTEDEAYCLLGLFKVNLPMVYGEGRKAFRRLQLEIIRSSTDQSIFAWSGTMTGGIVPIFATSPAAFVNSASVERVRQVEANPYAITNNGLEIRAELFEVRATPRRNAHYFILLACRNASGTALQIMLEQGQTRYFRCLADDIAYRPRESGERSLGKRVIYIDTGEEDTDDI